MDLKDFDLEAEANEGASLNLYNPHTKEELVGEDGKPITLRVLGAESGEFRRAVADAERDLAGKKNITMAMRDAASAKALAKAVVGWSDGLTWDEKPFPYSPENALRLMRERRWIRVQVDEFIVDARNFQKRG